MPKRKEPLIVEHIYHIFNRSIQGYKIFNNNDDYSRMLTTICYYQYAEISGKLSKSTKLTKVDNKNILSITPPPGARKHVNIIAYCLMPTHFHLILKQLSENGILKFMHAILNSYTHYFNIKYERKGTLWEGRFRNLLVNTDEQLIHLTRYIHLNPVAASLVDRSELWHASSYREYLSISRPEYRICEYSDVLDIQPQSYREFVEKTAPGAG